MVSGVERIELTVLRWRRPPICEKQIDASQNCDAITAPTLIRLIRLSLDLQYFLPDALPRRHVIYQVWVGQLTPRHWLMNLIWIPFIQPRQAGMG